MKYLFLTFTLFALASALMPRQLAPSFSAQAVMPNLSFKRISLSDYAGKFVVLLFYPFDFTYVCPTEILSYASNIEEFRSKRFLIKNIILRFWQFQLTHISRISPGERPKRRMVVLGQLTFP